MSERYAPTTDERFDRLAGQVAAWARETFPDQTPQTITSHLTAEVGELVDRQALEEAADGTILVLAWLNRTLHAPAAFRAALRASIERHLPLDAADLHDTQEYEAAQAVMTGLLAWCALNGHSFADLLDAVERKHGVNLTRRWRKGEQGYHEHVRE